MRYELWRYPGTPGHAAYCVRSSAARIGHELRQTLRAAALSAAAHLAACGLRYPPDGWAVLERGAPPDVITPLPPRHLGVIMERPTYLSLPKTVVDALSASSSVEHAAELLAPLGASLELEGAGAPACPVGYVRLRLEDGEETLLRTLPLTSGGAR